MAASMVMRHLPIKYSNISQFKAFMTYSKVQKLRKLQIIQNPTRTVSCQVVLFTDKPLGESEMKKMMESLTDKFAEAREMLGDARESQGTVYFSEDIEEARQAVDETLKEYRNLLDKLSDSQRQEVTSVLGLRMEELKAQQAAIDEELKA